MNIAKLGENRVMEQGEQVTLIFEGRETVSYTHLTLPTKRIV